MKDQVKVGLVHSVWATKKDDLQQERKLMIYCKLVSYLPAVYATDDVIAEVGEEITSFMHPKPNNRSTLLKSTTGKGSTLRLCIQCIAPEEIVHRRIIKIYLFFDENMMRYIQRYKFAEPPMICDFTFKVTGGSSEKKLLQEKHGDTREVQTKLITYTRTQKLHQL